MTRIMTLVQGSKEDIKEPRLMICPKCEKCFKFPVDIEPPVCPECKFRFPKRNQTRSSMKK